MTRPVCEGPHGMRMYATTTLAWANGQVRLCSTHAQAARLILYRPGSDQLTRTRLLAQLRN